MNAPHSTAAEPTSVKRRFRLPAYIDRPWRILQVAVLGFFKDHALRHAASISFYTALSLGPIVILLLTLMGALYSESYAQEEISREVEHYVGGPAADAMENMIRQGKRIRHFGWATLVSAGLLVFSATAVFAQLHDSMNQMWNVPPRNRSGFIEFLVKRAIALAMLAVLSLFSLSLLFVDSVMKFLESHFADIHPVISFFWPWVDWGVSFLVFALLFLVIFKFLPDFKVPWSDAALGTIITAVLFGLGREVISLMLSFSSVSSAYGVSGSVIMILLWVYYSSAILFFGAELTQSIYADRCAARQECHVDPAGLGDLNHSLEN
ncbi:MAG: YihY/virulence factor BrkB family protein [Phycisphaerae bacterium]